MQPIILTSSIKTSTTASMGHGIVVVVETTRSIDSQ